MAEQNVKGGNVREVSLVSNEIARPANKGGNLLARQDPLIDTHGATPKRVSLLGGAVLSIGIAAFAFGCDDGKSADEIPDAGWDGGECEDGCPDGGANDAVLELCGEPGSAVSDNEELIAVGGKKAVFTKSGRNIVAVEIDEENEFVVVRLAEDKGEPLDNGHFGYDEMDSEDPTISVYEDESKAVTLGFCGIENSEEGIAARIVSDRENGFVHCEDINSGSDSVPVEHAIDESTVEVLVSNVKAEGQVAWDGDTEDCDPETDTLMKQYITFEDTGGVPTSLTSRNVLLFSEAQTLKIHRLVEGLLQTFEVDLLEVDGVAGTVKIATENLGVGILQIGHSMEAGDLRVTLNGFNGQVPDFSYSSISNPDAEIWTTETENPNEKEVNILSGDVTTVFVHRFSNNKGDDMVDAKVFAKSAMSVLGSGSEANLNGVIYGSATDIDAAGITKITLTPED